MKLINVSKKGTLKFQLKDGRYLLNYTSGYVRIDGDLDRIYQIDKTRRIPPNTKGNYFEMVERILIHCPKERYQYCIDWVKRNVKNVNFRHQKAINVKHENIKYYQERILQLQHELKTII